jgi:alpha-D-xyloside xylohydrolase
VKFTSGFWRVADGFQVSYGQHVYDVVRRDRSLTAHVPTRRVESRRNTLNNPVISVTCTSPLPGVIGVRITHHAGSSPRRPSFTLHGRDDHPVDIAVDKATARLTSAELSVQIALDGDWRMTFSTPDGVLTSSGRKSLGYVTAADGQHYLHERLALDVGECVYGLGERSSAFVRNGQSVDMWNDDGGPSSHHAYKNVPFYLTNRGYGVFVATPGPASFEVGSEFISQVQFSVPGEELTYYVVAGDSPKAILDRYTRLTGRPAVPPAWSFGLWLSTSFVTSYSEQTATELVDGMRQRELPLSVFHFDSFWMREFHWCDFEWDPRRFPDPAGMLRRLKERGLRISVWINPYVAQQSALFDEGTERGFFLTLADGSVWQTDTWQAGMAVVDFTNPDARRWYQDKLRALLDQGVDCFKTDFGERIPVNVRYSDGSDPVLMHNYYSYLYNQAVFEVIREHGGEPVLFARSATAGGQQFPVHWGGDPEPTYVSMSESLRAGLSLGLCGFGFWSHDIGGFEGIPDAGLFMRWAAFGLLSSHSRLHGAINYRVPWEFGDQAVEVVRSFAGLKMRLMPYLLAAAHEAAAGGVPVMRAMVLEFMDDPSCLHLDRQYMLGPDLLVAPVFTDDGTVTYYVPDGEWLGLESGLPVRGPGWRTERHGYHSLPLLVRPGAVIATGAAGTCPEYDYRDGAVLVIGALTEGMHREVRIAAPDEARYPDEARPSRFSVDYREGRLVIDADARRPWTAVLLGRQAAVRCAGGSIATEERGLRVTPESPAGTVQVVL